MSSSSPFFTHKVGYAGRLHHNPSVAVGQSETLHGESRDAFARRQRAGKDCAEAHAPVVQSSRMASAERGEEPARPGSPNQDGLSHGQAFEHEALWLPLRHRQGRVEEVEEAIFCVSSRYLSGKCFSMHESHNLLPSSFTIYICNVHL